MTPIVCYGSKSTREMLFRDDWIFLYSLWAGFRHPEQPTQVAHSAVSLLGYALFRRQRRLQ